MVIAQDSPFSLIFRIFTAAYLIWIGLRMLILPAAWRSVSGHGQPFLVGLLTGLTNPFAITFWLGAFLGIIPADAPGHVYVEIFTVIILQTMAWYSFLAVLLGSI
jgi:threonine/homoserine/homoserine lactone efflux protein